MSTLRFRATAEMQKFLYRKGGWTERGGKRVLAEPLILRHGDAVRCQDDEDAWLAVWCATNYPMNFSLGSDEPADDADALKALFAD